MSSSLPSSHHDSTAARTVQRLIEVRGYRSYLELGCRDDATFSQVSCAHKVGVDSARGGTLRMSTDEYFAKHDERFDVVFVDACHVHSQVMRDVRNVLRILEPGGTIVMHDCYPYFRAYENADGRASGTVWRAFVHLRTDPDLDVVCGNYDHGVGLVRRGRNERVLMGIPPMEDLTYDHLEKNIDEWLDLRSWDEIQVWIRSQAVSRRVEPDCVDVSAEGDRPVDLDAVEISHGRVASRRALDHR